MPKEGNIINLRIISDLRRNLAATEEEIKKYHIGSTLQPDGTSQIKWNPEFEAEIEIGEATIEIIKRELISLSVAEKLTEDFLPLYGLIVDPPKES